MLKFLLIIVIAVYLLSKLGRLFFGMGMSSSQNRTNGRPSNKNSNSVNSKKESKIKGGEYIDFEEIK